MDRVLRWMKTASAALEQYPAVGEDVYALSSYYESDLWMKDYEADEAGQLPADLKRGVLSEDGLYNLLAEYGDLISKLRNL